MNDVLLDAFRHNVWATKELIAACRSLTDEQLNTPASATYGSILATFTHTICGDAGYLSILGGTRVEWARKGDDIVGLDVLDARVDEIAPLWEQLLSRPIDTDGIIVMDEGAYESYAGIVIAQALHHSNAHREQICSILTGYGVEPPGLDPWDFADATGRSRFRTTS